jgi:NAD(P)-dependent dehydrogenase (short-subunit alcohol dehydrogenase family)
VAPGPVYSDGAAPERIDALATTTLLGRGAQPEEIADVIAFLCTPRAVRDRGHHPGRRRPGRHLRQCTATGHTT